jgi:hypothetical protein
MRLALLICYIFVGGAHANSEDVVKIYPEPSQDFIINSEIILNYTARLAVLEETNKQSESKYTTLKESHETLLVELKEIKQKAKESSSGLLKNSTQINSLTQQYDDIKSIDNTLNNQSNNNSFDTWMGFLLASVSIIVTGLGVIIAILALWGYKNIKQAAIDGAVNKSAILTKEAIESGKFNELIYTVTERAIYRGILSDNDFPESEEDINETL